MKSTTSLMLDSDILARVRFEKLNLSATVNSYLKNYFADADKKQQKEAEEVLTDGTV